MRNGALDGEKFTRRDDFSTMSGARRAILLRMVRLRSSRLRSRRRRDSDAELARRVAARTAVLSAANAVLAEQLQAAREAAANAEARAHALLAVSGMAALEGATEPADRALSGLAQGEDGERYRRLFEASVDAIVLTDDRGIFLDANDAAAHLFGIPREDLIGKCADDFREDAGPETAARHRQYLESGRDAGELPFRRPDGSLRLAQYTAVRLGVNLHQSILRDITDEREAELRLRNSLSEKEILLKEIHHRVKNNLQVIASMLRLQSDQIADLHVRELFLESQRRVRAMALVHERLYKAPDLARLDLGAYVRSLAADLLRAYRLPAGSVSVRVEVSVAGIDIDQAVALGLLLNELIANCLKHAFKAGQHGTIAVTATRSPSGALVLTVSDDGVGLPQGLDPASSPTMGLQIVQALASQLGGTLSWRRSYGTAATLIVPVRP